jgi:hypothetical protein
MSTVHTPPIDLYEESIEMEGLKPEEGRSDDDVRRTTPRDNGDVDQPALDAGGERLSQVLGW